MVDWGGCDLEVEWRGRELLRRNEMECCFSLGEMQLSAELLGKQRTCFHVLRKLVRLEGYRDFLIFFNLSWPFFLWQDSAG